MIGDFPLIDAHVHAARLPTLKQSWRDWEARYGSPASRYKLTQIQHGLIV